MDQRHTFTVSELNGDVKTLLQDHYATVLVEGEISNFVAASSGHWYFSLKDDRSQVRCAMFRRANLRVRPRPENGDQVTIRAAVSLYEARGEFQLICETMDAAGDGALQLAFERLKKRLADEGLFDPELKKAVPGDCATVGVVTSPTGAAIHDIQSVLERRSPMTAVYLLPVAVQGNGAAAAISAAIDQANRLVTAGQLSLDALIVGRGGGSLEDLWSFNEESVARAIAASAIPVVSAVGHEIDFSIADFAADIRAATPSAAAELVTTDQRERMQQLDAITAQLNRFMVGRTSQYREKLGHLRARLRHPSSQVRQQEARLTDLKTRLRRAIDAQLVAKNDHMRSLRLRLHRESPAYRAQISRKQVVDAGQRMSLLIHRKLTSTKERLNQQRRLLQSLGPEGTLARGYAIVQTEDGAVVKRQNQVQSGQSLRVRLGSGNIDVAVLKTRKTT
ncbi:exodeoxyribonuclease VII, large subunit [Luminiphilus syltensis NOR5-1B]|uniref:Exodeoxyribonuclease 7 large subunit n=1 Tax=Luminiphilus syltensis NOR5-1B TaxID=565045 RepID=B8KXE7_9GAMM|nr:exodeoxyribonuclease VII large subunit [Luminiphilus syltensis]EED34260.1 exodeoxyribonuclease VII, large subunit [Luminiphilus syltensis NOR5-1B]